MSKSRSRLGETAAWPPRTTSLQSGRTQQHKNNNEAQRHAKQPQKNWHDQFLTALVFTVPVSSYQRSLRSLPPSAAARLAESAPARRAIATQIEKLIAARRALSAASFACVTAWLTRCSASA